MGAREKRVRGGRRLTAALSRSLPAREERAQPNALVRGQRLVEPRSEQLAVVEDHAAPCVNPSGVCTTCSNVDQLTIAPSANAFSATGMNDFSVSAEYVTQFARGIWNWLTNV